MSDREIVALDSSFLIEALDPGRQTARAIICRAALDTLLQNNEKYDVVIPAPVVAEIQADPKRSPVPRVHGITVVPFDDECADLLLDRGCLMTFGDGRSKGYWKYDVMIAACAIVAHASYIVSCDSDFLKIAEKIGLPVLAPEALMERKTLMLPFSGGW